MKQLSLLAITLCLLSCATGFNVNKLQQASSLSRYVKKSARFSIDFGGVKDVRKELDREFVAASEINYINNDNSEKLAEQLSFTTFLSLSDLCDIIVSVNRVPKISARFHFRLPFLLDISATPGFSYISISKSNNKNPGRTIGDIFITIMTLGLVNPDTPAKFSTDLTASFLDLPVIISRRLSESFVLYTGPQVMMTTIDAKITRERIATNIADVVVNSSVGLLDEERSGTLIDLGAFLGVSARVSHTFYLHGELTIIRKNKKTPEETRKTNLLGAMNLTWFFGTTPGN